MWLKSRVLRGAAGLTAVVAVVCLASLSPRAQGGPTITFPSVLPAGPDFATDVLADPWDMSNPEDLSPDPTETANWTSFTVSGGLFTGTTANNDSNISLLHRGYYGIINPGKNGRNFPINTSKYRKLAYRISYSGANEQPQIYWFHNAWSDPASQPGSLGASIGVQLPGFMNAGYQVVVIDMTGPSGGVAWTAPDQNGSTNVVGFRIDPNNGAVTNNQVSLDWVRLTAADNDTANGAAMQVISWSGGSGSGATTIDLMDSAGSTKILTIASGLASGTTSYNWNYGIMPPGSYNLRVTRGGVAGPMKPFTINTPPIIQLTSPDATGGQDYATTVMPNPWTMNSLNDVQTFANMTAPSIVNGEFTATNTNGDPNLELLNNSAAPIDTSKYHYLTYTLTVDGAYDLANGSVTRVFWTSAPSLDGSTATTTKDIIAWPGRHTYTIDLAGLTTAADGGLEISGPHESWAPLSKRFFRFDPHEFASPRTFHIGPMKLAAMNESNGSFTIKWAGYPFAPAAPGTQVALYYDNDQDPSNGKTLIASALSMASGSYVWNTSGVTPGVYYIYAVASDGVQTYGRYASGQIRVNSPTPTTIPSMSLDAPANGSTVIEPFAISGWAIDQGASSGSGVDAVHIWAQPSGGGAATFVGVANYFGARGDVGSIFGAQFTNSGFWLLVNNLAPGTYTLTAYAHSTMTGTFNQARSTTITVPASLPLLNIDTPSAGSTVSQPMFVAGWAIDVAAPTGTGVDTVHVYGYPNPGSGTPPVFLGVASYGGPRGDVGAAFGSRFTNSSFMVTAPVLAAGTWRVVAFAHSVVSGQFNGVTTVDVTLSPPPGPAMSIDSPGGGASFNGTGGFIVAGWAIDRAASSGTGVDAINVWAFPVSGSGGPYFAGSGGYGGSRSDIGAAFGGRFTNSGFNTWVSGVPPGTYTLVVYARSTATGTFNQSKSIQVRIQ